MARFQNFHIWRGKLPHWRADDVVYFVTFRHSRELEDDEMGPLYQALLAASGRKWDVDAIVVLPARSEMLVRVLEGGKGVPFELSDIVEAAKRKAGKKIVKVTGERYAPFYGESFDRIVRDEAEYAEKLQAIAAAPWSEGCASEGDEWPWLWLPPTRDDD